MCVVHYRTFQMLSHLQALKVESTSRYASLKYFRAQVQQSPNGVIFDILHNFEFARTVIVFHIHEIIRHMTAWGTITGCLLPKQAQLAKH